MQAVLRFGGGFPELHVIVYLHTLPEVIIISPFAL